MKIGDTIKYLNESGTAQIKEIHRNHLVVEDEFGFERTVQKTEILALENELNKEEISTESYVSLKPKPPKKNVTEKTKILQEMVVDLHFSQIVDFPNQYEVDEILPIQINRAKEALQKNRGKVSKLILIHGKGSGKLEKEVYMILQNTKGIRFKEADFNRYKLGAVEITYV